jgi:hypothetical protein
MPTPPDGAQISPDGFYWWDDSSMDWVAINDAPVAEPEPAAEDIPFLKFLSAEVLTPTVSPRTLGVWARYDIVNMGTAPSTDEIDVSWGLGHSGAIFAEGRHKFDPPVAANGGSYNGTINMEGHHMQFAGDWVLEIQIDLGMNKGISDSVTLPFTVELTDPEDA